MTEKQLLFMRSDYLAHLLFGHWLLALIWSLGFGYWDLDKRRYASLLKNHSSPVGSS